jgi:hypothetical protein
MPAWPLWPLVSLAGCALILWFQQVGDLLTAGAILAASVLYYAIYLRPRSATHWVMLAPANDTDDSTSRGDRVG